MQNEINFQEKKLSPRQGVPILFFNILAMIGFFALFIVGIILSVEDIPILGIPLIIIGSICGFIVCPILFVGLKSVRPNEAYVFTLFGDYYGTLDKPGFYFVHPFVSAVAPPIGGSITDPTQFMNSLGGAIENETKGKTSTKQLVPSKKISLKTMTHLNERQKINDALGNPIEVGIAVTWRVNDTVKALFQVDNYVEYLSVQCDSSLRDIVRAYPYDAKDDDSSEKSLRGSSQEVSEQLERAIAEKVSIAGLEIIDARITHLAYAPEIAAAMLQRQQASAIVDARQLIVDGAVGMVEMALEKLNENQIVQLDEERKAAMVSNLLVVLCGNRDAQPIVNSGSLY